MGPYRIAAINEQVSCIEGAYQVCASQVCTPISTSVKSASLFAYLRWHRSEEDKEQLLPSAETSSRRPRSGHGRGEGRRGRKKRQVSGGGADFSTSEERSTGLEVGRLAHTHAHFSSKVHREGYAAGGGLRMYNTYMTWTRTWTHGHAHAYGHMGMYMHMSMYMCVYMDMDMDMCVHVHVHVHVYTHTYTHT